MSAPDLVRLSELVANADASWIAKAGGDVPLLKMPKETFAWDERMGYFANTSVYGDQLWLEVRAFDGPARRDLDPRELDWCIPLAYDGAPEIDRLGWKLGWGEGWSDSKAVLRLRFSGESFRVFFADVVRVKKLAIATAGEKTASLLLQLERNMDDFASFAKL